MNLLNISWKNLTNKPLALLLSLSLFGLGIGLIVLLLLLNKQIDDKFEKNLAGIDVVIGAKGSPLQMVLCNMYHIDNPTGNISLKAARPFLNPKHPIIELSVPLSLGDSYKGYRILGTLPEYVTSVYQGKVAEGHLWEKPLEVTAGAIVAEKLNLKIGDTFHSSHGLIDDGINVHDDVAPFKVVGILQKSGSVIDQLLMTSTQSIWAVHDHEHEGHDHEHEDHAEESHEHEGQDHNHEDHAEESHEHEGHDHEGHDHTDKAKAIDERQLLMDSPDKEVTSLLIRFKNRRGIPALNFPRNINENTDLLAASPAYERSRLTTMMGAGERGLRALAIAIIFVSGLSVFISLFSSLKERKYELALTRIMGAPRTTLFALIIIEGLLVAFIGAVFGIMLGHLGMELLAGTMESSYRYSFTGFLFLEEEVIVLLAAIFVGILAAIVPAMQAYRTDISETLMMR